MRTAFSSLSATPFLRRLRDGLARQNQSLNLRMVKRAMVDAHLIDLALERLRSRNVPHDQVTQWIEIPRPRRSAPDKIAVHVDPGFVLPASRDDREMLPCVPLYRFRLR